MTARNLQSKVSTAVLRAGQQPVQVVDDLGPLSNLSGTWMGLGWNLIAVPDKSRKSPFLLLRAPFIETLTFSPLGGAIPNRGDTETQLIFGVQYEQRICGATDNRPLHIENGMWLLLNAEERLIARQSTIPHGDALLSLGNASVDPGPPPIQPINPLPFFLGKAQPPADASSQSSRYNAPYFEPVPGFNTLDPNAFLRNKIADQRIVETTTLNVSTKEKGGVVNIPFIVKNANATLLESTFWIETVLDPETNETFQQLQYTQLVHLEFPPSNREDLALPEPMIVWPHISVATLTKQ